MLVVNLDLVIPAIIKDRLETVKRIKEESHYSEGYFIISPLSIMSFARWIKTLHFGRVVINFTEEDALAYLRANSDVFKEYKEYDPAHIFIIKFSEYTEENIQKYIDKLTLNINYDDEVMEFFNL